MEFNVNANGWTLICASLLLVFGGAPAKANLVTVALDWEIDYQQTGPSTVVPQDAYLFPYAAWQNAPDYTSGTLSYPGAGSPQTLSPDGPDFLDYTQQFADFSSLQAAYPFGTYTFQGFGPGGPSSAVSIDYTGNGFPNTPALTANSFTALQGLNPADSITLNFNQFLPGGSFDGYDSEFWIYDGGTFNVVAGEYVLSSSQTSLVIPGGTLAPNTAYTYGLYYANDIFGQDTLGSGIDTYQIFDSGTLGDFTTAAPEPHYFAILVLGLMILFVVRWHRSAPYCR